MYTASGTCMALGSQLDSLLAQVLIRSGTPQEKKYAERIAPVGCPFHPLQLCIRSAHHQPACMHACIPASPALRHADAASPCTPGSALPCAGFCNQVLKRPHLLLVTLLLVNAAAMEALPIFLDRLMSPTSAIILSVTAVLFFGARLWLPPLQ